MEFLVLLRPTRPDFVQSMTEEETRAVGQHLEHLKAAAAAGKVLVAGRSMTDNPVGVEIIEADSEEEARKLVEQDPAVKEGIMRPEILPFRVAVSALKVR